MIAAPTCHNPFGWEEGAAPLADACIFHFIVFDLPQQREDIWKRIFQMGGFESRRGSIFHLI